MQVLFQVFQVVVIDIVEFIERRVEVRVRDDRRAVVEAQAGHLAQSSRRAAVTRDDLEQFDEREFTLPPDDVVAREPVEDRGRVEEGVDSAPDDELGIFQRGGDFQGLSQLGSRHREADGIELA
ncbi:MAG: hypothetical protein FD129_3151 [bacterium]|nr:MAG: hypothetical protein FD129_3151 [bacterium]